MPRTIQEILDHADEIAARFEAFEPVDEGRDATMLRRLLAAVIARSDADRAVIQAVVDARQAGDPWNAIGLVLGTSGEAARQKYGEFIAASSGGRRPR